MLNTAHLLPKQRQLTDITQNALKILRNNASTAATCYSIIPVHV